MLKKFFVFSVWIDAQPTDLERESYEIVDEVLQYSKDILQELQTYKGAVNEIREVITILFMFTLVYLNFYFDKFCSEGDFVDRF